MFSNRFIDSSGQSPRVVAHPSRGGGKSEGTADTWLFQEDAQASEGARVCRLGRWPGTQFEKEDSEEGKKTRGDAHGDPQIPWQFPTPKSTRRAGNNRDKRYPQKSPGDCLMVFVGQTGAAAERTSVGSQRLICNLAYSYSYSSSFLVLFQKHKSFS